MDVRELLMVLLLGLPLPAQAISREYHFVDLLKTWTEAQSYCREKFADLATIESLDDWIRIREMVANSGHPDVWLGLFDDVKSWRWSLDNASLYEQDLGSWFVFDEDNVDSQEHCADLSAGSFSDSKCGQAQMSVCYDESSNAYIPVADAKTWQSAQSFCRQTYTDLASVRNQQELNDVTSVLDSSQRYWVGLSRDGWKWSDQSGDFSLPIWKSGNPAGGTEICGGAEVVGIFDWDCLIPIPFICSAPQRKVLKVTLKTDGSVDLNDPLVQEAIRKQMEKDLRGQGLHQKLGLSWRKQPHGDVFNKTEL